MVRNDDRWMRIASHVQIAIVVIMVLAPVAWIILGAFKPSHLVTAYPPKLFFTPTLDNFVKLFESTPFAEYTVNSIIVATGSTVLGLLFGIPAAFAISWTRINWPMTVTLLARMAPGGLFLLPWYVLFNAMGLVGSHFVLIITHAVITMPVSIMVMLSFFDAIPRSVLESAQIDGCPYWKILTRICMPLVTPGVVVATILSFIFSWNYFLFALILSNSSSKTLIAASFNFIGEGSTQWGALMAAALLIALPPLILASLVQKRLIGGLSVGAVKG